MELTQAMKRFALARGWVQQGASDDDIRKALGAKLIAGEITGEAWALLLQDRQPDARSVLTSLIDERLSGMETRLAGVLTGALASVGLAIRSPEGQQQGTAQGGQQQGNGGQQGQAGGTTVVVAPPAPGTPTQPPAQPAGGQGGQQGQGGQTDFQGVVQRSVASILAQHGFVMPGDQGGERVSPTALLGGAAQRSYLENGSIRVKGVVEKFNQDRAEVRYPANSKHVHLRGQRVTFPSEQGPGMGRPLHAPSQADKAIAGAWFKWALHCGGYGQELPSRYRMTELDVELLKYAIHELPWTGLLGDDGDSQNSQATGIDGVKLADVQHRGKPGVKALLDDSVSGGITVAPQIVEDAIILTPLLYGELFPEVTVTNLARGRRITAATMGTPTFTSGTPENTPIPLFDTTNFIGSLDFTIFNAVGAMEIGIDFEEDSPQDLGAAIIARYGEAALQWLDRVIALGDGVTEPTGIFNTTGATTVVSANGATGPLTVADAEALMFGVNKAFRTSRGGRNVFISNEVNYRRFRGIPTATGGNDRVFGDQYGDYNVLGHPFKIVPGVPNTKIAYQNLAYFRLYRRLGLTVKVEAGGKDLSLRNVRLIICRMRWGGRVELGGSTALMVSAPT
jgi:HK97 family phage major capsid protein